MRNSQNLQTSYAKMRDLDWDDLCFFLAVSERDAIFGAAEFLKVNHSTVARRLTSLEKRPGARLFDRLPDGYELIAREDELHDRLGVTDP